MDSAARYLLDVGGDNGPSYVRPWWILGSGSVLFRVGSPFREWPWAHGLRPFEHYIPIRADLRDLAEKVRWAREHDEELRRIRVNARERFDEIVDSPYCVLRYMAAWIAEYASLFPPLS